jgi:hypothetical protein
MSSTRASRDCESKPIFRWIIQFNEVEDIVKLPLCFAKYILLDAIMIESHPSCDSAFEKFYELFLPVTDYFEIDEIKKLVENMHNLQASDPNDFVLLLKSIRKLNTNDSVYSNRCSLWSFYCFDLLCRMIQHSAFVQKLNSPDRAVLKFYGAPLDQFLSATLEKFSFSMVWVFHATITLSLTARDCMGVACILLPIQY